MLLPNLNQLPFFFKLLSLSNPLFKKIKATPSIYTSIHVYRDRCSCPDEKSDQLIPQAFYGHTSLQIIYHRWQNPATYSSVLLHSWPQKQTAPLGNWAKCMSQQIPTEVGQEAEDYPCPISLLLPHGNLEPGWSGAVSFQRPHWTPSLPTQADRPRSPGRWYHCPMSPWNANFHFEGTQRHRTAQA